jgi:hypothetical protein
MQASIDFDGTLTGSIAGGSGGGSDVSITPTYHQGTKIADYSIDGNEGAIYTPEIEILKNVLSGVKICEIEGVEIFAPSCGYIDTLGDSNIEQIGGFSQGANVTPVNVKRVSYTNDVSNGEKIGSLTVGDSSFNIYQKPNTSINYSLTKQKTGRKWIDGRDIYLQVIKGTTDNQLYYIPNTTNIDILISYGGFITVSGYNFYTPYSDGGDYISIANGSGGVRFYTSNYFVNKEYTIILEFVEAVS